MKRSPLEALYSTLNVPVTPVKVQEDVDRLLPNAGTASMESQYNSSVRSNTEITEATKPEAQPETEQEKVADLHWELLQAGWGRR
jgi:hypothetical protein